MRQLLAVLWALALPVIGADHQWERLKTLRPGEKIWIHYMQGGRLKADKAEMAAWQEDSLAIRLKKSEVVLSRNDVRKVAVYGGKSHAKGAGYGALAGAAVGAAVYGVAVAAADDLDVSPAAVVAAGSLVIGGVGAVVGAIVGATKRVTIYEARESGRDQGAAVPAQADGR